MNSELMRHIDSICRDKNIDKELFIADLEGAMTSAIRKNYEVEEATVSLDPLTGQIAATVEGATIDMQTLGRIAAQTAKQVIIQKTRERERVSIQDEYSERQGTIVTGTVTRVERGNVIVNLGRTDGFLPRSEQIPGETHPIGARVRVMILEVREQGNQVRIVVSRSHPEFIVRLFELEVPEVSERIIEIKALAREAGYRTKVAVSSIDSKVDAVGACVGVRGSRIKNIVEELGGEKIDIVRWNESSQILIQNALKPAEVAEIALCLELGKATVVVADDQLSLAIGKRGQNVRLAARLTGWDIDILTPPEHTKNLERLAAAARTVEGVDDVVIDKLIALGVVSVYDMDEIDDTTPLVETLEIEQDMAEKIIEACGEAVIELEEAKEAAEKAKAEAEARGEKPGAAKGGPSGFVADSDSSSPFLDSAATPATPKPEAKPESGDPFIDPNAAAPAAEPAAVDADSSEPPAENAPDASATRDAARDAATESTSTDASVVAVDVSAAQVDPTGGAPGAAVVEDAPADTEAPTDSATPVADESPDPREGSTS